MPASCALFNHNSNISSLKNYFRKILTKEVYVNCYEVSFATYSLMQKENRDAELSVQHYNNSWMYNL